VDANERASWLYISGPRRAAEDTVENITVSLRAPSARADERQVAGGRSLTEQDRRRHRAGIAATGSEASLLLGNSDVPRRGLIDLRFTHYIGRVRIGFSCEENMTRHALAPIGPTREQVLVAIPRRATDWTLAQANRGMHRLLVPVDARLRAVDALRYIVEHAHDHVSGVHVVNVQRPVMSGDVGVLATARMATDSRLAAGQRILALAREALSDSMIPMTGEVAFGAPAETICRIAEERGCTGIVIARDGFELHDLIGGSVAARVLRLASVPVTIVNPRAAALVARGELKRSWSSGDRAAMTARPAWSEPSIEIGSELGERLSAEVD
jgi:nucleotide-binding universal stress UspA family protein